VSHRFRFGYTLWSHIDFTLVSTLWFHTISHWFHIDFTWFSLILGFVDEGFVEGFVEGLVDEGFVEGFVEGSEQWISLDQHGFALK
jgi:hypothetical protein